MDTETSAVASSTQLFDQVERPRITTRGHNEGAYAFLNSCGWPSLFRLREFWEGWFAQYDGDRKDLGARFRSPIRHTHLSAFLELFTFACLKRAAYDVKVAPVVGAYTVDFLAAHSASGVSMYVECTATGQSRAEAAADLRKAEVLNAIDKVATGHLTIGANVIAAGANPASLKALRREYEPWIRSLSQDSAVDQDARWTWTRDGWQVDFWATAVDGEGGLGMIGPDIFDAGEQPIRLRDAINEKARKYGILDRPYLIVTNSIKHQGDRELGLAVAGDRYAQVNTVTREASILRKANGVFVNTHGAINTTMSALMHGHCGALSFAGNQKFVMVHHPHAARPLPTGLFPFCEEWTFDHEGDLVFTAASSTVAEFFGLPNGRPYFDNDPE